MSVVIPYLYVFEFNEGMALVAHVNQEAAVDLLMRERGMLPQLEAKYSIALPQQQELAFHAKIVAMRGVINLNQRMISNAAEPFRQQRAIDHAKDPDEIIYQEAKSAPTPHGMEEMSDFSV
jgi:hypothetical protein